MTAATRASLAAALALLLAPVAARAQTAYINLITSEGATHAWPATATSTTADVIGVGGSNYPLGCGTGPCVFGTPITSSGIQGYAGNGATFLSMLPSVQISSSAPWTFEAFVNFSGTSQQNITSFDSGSAMVIVGYYSGGSCTNPGQTAIGVFAGGTFYGTCIPAINDGVGHVIDIEAPAAGAGATVTTFVDANPVSGGAPAGATIGTTTYGGLGVGFYSIGSGSSVGNDPLNGAVGMLSVFPSQLTGPQVLVNANCGLRGLCGQKAAGGGGLVN